MTLVAFYAGLNLVAWFMIFCFVRETKQLTLEELDRKSHIACLIWPHADVSLTEVFSVPTKSFITHELTVSLPYFIKRQVFRQRVAKPPPIIERAEKADTFREA